MNTHNKMMLKTIQKFCKEYITGKINLVALQSSVEAVRSNLESDVDVKLKNKIFYFVERLEGIRFMSEDEDHPKLVSEEINKLNSLIEAAMNDQVTDV